MCTCLKFENGGFYFGRNLDLEYSFGELSLLPGTIRLSGKVREAPGGITPWWEWPPY